MKHSAFFFAFLFWSCSLLGQTEKNTWHLSLHGFNPGITTLGATNNVSNMGFGLALGKTIYETDEKRYELKYVATGYAFSSGFFFTRNLCAGLSWKHYNFRQNGYYHVVGEQSEASSWLGMHAIKYFDLKTPKKKVWLKAACAIGTGSSDIEYPAAGQSKGDVSHTFRQYGLGGGLSWFLGSRVSLDCGMHYNVSTTEPVYAWKRPDRITQKGFTTQIGVSVFL
jgi:hypothetical protein